MGEKIDGIEARASGLRFRKLKQRSTEAGPASGGMNSDVIYEESLAGNGKDDEGSTSFVPWLGCLARSTPGPSSSLGKVSAYKCGSTQNRVSLLVPYSDGCRIAA